MRDLCMSKAYWRGVSPHAAGSIAREASNRPDDILDSDRVHTIVKAIPRRAVPSLVPVTCVIGHSEYYHARLIKDHAQCFVHVQVNEP